MQIRVLALSLAMVAASLVAAEPRPAVHVTGRLLDVNGQTEIPRGLFGLHADLALKEEMVKEWGVECYRQIHYVPGGGSVAIGRDGQVKDLFKPLAVVIDCQGDRFYPATCLSDPNFVKSYDRIGRQYAQLCKDANWVGHAEFWNEPYLNWAERSRKNYDPKFYDEKKAVDGGPVTIKGRSEPLKYLKWRRLWAAGADGKINYMVPVPKDAKPGDKIEHEFSLYFQPKGRNTYTVVEKWDVYDPTAVSFWSGKQNYDFYMWMFLPWAKAIKEVNPKVQVVAGWDFHLSADGWKAWEMLYKPMIDESIQWLDGVCEHHYGSNTRVTTTEYEVAVAYAMAQYGKRLRCYNTETAGCVDPAVPGNTHSNATPYGAFNYGLRDIVELIWRSPDKAVSRTAHGSLSAGWGGGGDVPRFKMFKDLRGRLVHAASDDLNLWPAVGLNGDKLVMAIYNDNSGSREVELSVDAPAGTTLAGGVKAWATPRSDGGPLETHEEAVKAEGKAAMLTVTIPARTGVKLALNLKGEPAKKTQVLRRQFFATRPEGGAAVLNRIAPGKPVTVNVKADGELAARAETAWIRLALEGVKRGEATVIVNGSAVKRPDMNNVIEVPVDVKLLKAENVLKFETSGEGYMVCAASIVIDASAK